jgi:tripartite-type tricarboxylate transporter receptor subunit TctC
MRKNVMHIKKLAAGSLISFLIAVSINSPHAIGQEVYPSRPVRIILSLPAGSAPDIRTRIIANQLTTIW